MSRDQPLDVGVIGIGSMGQNHARVYDDSTAARLVGVCDADPERAAAVAAEYGVPAMGIDRLLDSVDAASVVVPTPYHYEVTSQCLDAGVATLVEKPVVDDLEAGRKLRVKAKRADVPVQVGHIERFNPAVETLTELLENRSVVAIASRRLSPTPNPPIDDSAVFALMIHDIDIALTLLDETPIAVRSIGVLDNEHVTSLFEFESGVMASLTASHVTQRKIRTLEVTTKECLIQLDYMNQSIEIHHRSSPEYVEDGGRVRLRHESTVEHLWVPNTEPLRNELESFVEAVALNKPPRVSLDDGLRAIELAQRIEKQGLTTPTQTGRFHD
jgi:predicted dehydrogenase